MALKLQVAQRSQAFLKLGMAAPSGGGKTLGALIIAYGLMKEKYPNLTDKELWQKIAIIDTENGSGQLYANHEVPASNLIIGEYNAITLTPPFEAAFYIQAMQLCQDSGMEVCIIDSSTHLWSGEGGLLEQQNNAAKRGGNSYTAWREITPMHNKFVDKMLQTPMHVITTMRSKQEYSQEKNEQGKTIVRKLGLEPEQRKGMEYEFTTFFDIDEKHQAFGSKDRTSIFDQKYFEITPETGKKLMKWLQGSSQAVQEVVAEAKIEPANQPAAEKNVKSKIVALAKDLGGSGNADLMTVIKQFAPNGNPNSIQDVEVLNALYENLLSFEEAVNKEETKEEVGE